ncbi:MAG: pitrilysin family protein [Flavobacteriales bacterium]
MSSTMHRIARTCPLIGLSLFLPLFMTAQIDRSRPPTPGPAPTVQLGDHVTFTLKNGMRVILVENHKLPMVSVQVRFDIPPIVQGDKAGMVDMVGELLAAGTERLTKAQIDDQVDQLGATLATTNDGIYASCLKKNLGALLPVVQEITTAPSFPEREFDKVMTRTRSGLQQRREDPDGIAEVVSRAVTFGRAHPYGEVTTDRTLDNVAVKQIKGYYQLFFRPEKAYLVFVGDITEKEAKRLANEHFAGWKPARPATIKNADGSEDMDGLGRVRLMPKVATPSGTRRVNVVDRPGAAQSVIRVSFPLNLQPRDVRSLPAQVMNTILGGGVFNARLMQNLREDKGWTYGAYSSLDADRFNGHFHVSVSVRTPVTDSAVAETILELERLRREPVTKEELELAKRFMAGSFGRSLEDPRTVARFALNTYLNGLEEDHYATYLQRLEAVSVEDVQAAAQAFLHPDQAVILVVGDLERVEEGLAELSMDRARPVQRLDEDGALWEEAITPVTDRKAEDVISAYITAVGGRNAIAKAAHMRRAADGTLRGQPVRYTEWYAPGRLYRAESVVNDIPAEELVYDGERAARRDPNGQEELTDVDLQDLVFFAHPVPEADLEGRLDRMVLAGRTLVGERPAYKVMLMTQHGTSVADYFDAENGLLLQRVEEKFMAGRNLRVVTTYADHAPFEGLVLPTRIVRRGHPAGRLELTVGTVEFGRVPATGFFATGLPPVVEPTEFETDPDEWLNNMQPGGDDGSED